tara:strand:- start:41 stop:283 length:243 start_codon:yes stop_codon:yes gene_type:complete
MSDIKKFEAFVGSIIEEAENDEIGFVMHLSYMDNGSSEVKHFNISHKFPYDDLITAKENYIDFLNYAESTRDSEDKPEED